MSQVPPSSGSPYSPSPYGQGGPGTSPYTTPSASSASGAYPPAGQSGYGQPYAQQTPVYGAPSYPAAPGYGAPTGYGAGPVPQVRPTTGPKILLTVGLVMLIASVIAFAVSLTTLLNVTGSLSEIPRNGTATATLERGNVYGIYSGGLVTCDVADPSGNPVSVDSVSPSDATDVDGTPLIGIFTPQTSGDYTVSCHSSSSKPVYLGLSLNGGGLVASGLGIIGSVLLVLPGLFLTIGGVIWLGVRRSQNKQAQAAAGGYPGAQF